VNSSAHFRKLSHEIEHLEKEERSS